MGMHSEMVTCPNCLNDARLTTNSRVFASDNLECLNCGLERFPTTTYLSLEDLNEMRVENDLPRLEKLPSQNHSI